MITFQTLLKCKISMSKINNFSPNKKSYIKTKKNIIEGLFEIGY